MSIESELRTLTDAVVELTRAVARDSMIRTEIWNDSTRKALEVFPLSETEIRELAGQAEPVADPEPRGEETPQPAQRVAITTEETVEIAKRMLAAGLREEMKTFLKVDLGGQTVTALDEADRVRFSRYALERLEAVGETEQDAA